MAVVRAAGLQATVVVSRCATVATVSTHDHAPPVGPVRGILVALIAKPVKVETFMGRQVLAWADVCVREVQRRPRRSR